jgi:hypothetical protein
MHSRLKLMHVILPLKERREEPMARRRGTARVYAGVGFLPLGGATSAELGSDATREHGEVMCFTHVAMMTA